MDPCSSVLAIVSVATCVTPAPRWGRQAGLDTGSVQVLTDRAALHFRGTFLTPDFPTASMACPSTPLPSGYLGHVIYQGHVKEHAGIQPCGVVPTEAAR